MIDKTPCTEIFDRLSKRGRKIEREGDFSYIFCVCDNQIIVLLL